jgi:hypothetical protein
MEAATIMKMEIVTVLTSVDSMTNVVTRPNTHVRIHLNMPEIALIITTVIQLKVMERTALAIVQLIVFGIQIAVRSFLSTGRQAQLNLSIIGELFAASMAMKKNQMNCALHFQKWLR